MLPRTFLPKSAVLSCVQRLVLCAACCGFPALSVSLHAQSWTFVWSDEFDGTRGTPIDASKWQFERADIKVNNELQFYCAPSDAAPCDPKRPNAYIDGNGHLVIQAIRITDATAPSSNAWTSARMNTANNLASFQYGRIEARMQLPTGPGLWPAFWSLGTDINTVDWPNCGEMDFMENVPVSGGLGSDIVKSTIHGPGYSGGEGIGKDYKLPLGADVTMPHIYGAIWSPFMIQFYVDDPDNVFLVLTERDIPSGKQWVYNHPFFLLLNLAVGGNGSWPGPPAPDTPSPARMVVDYVRVYRAQKVSPPRVTPPKSILLTEGSVATTEVVFTAKPGTGRVYLKCSTDAPQSTCQVSTGNKLNDAVADFVAEATVAAKIQVRTSADREVTRQKQSGSASPLVSYSVTVKAYSITSDENDPSSYTTISIPLLAE